MKSVPLYACGISGGRAFLLALCLALPCTARTNYVTLAGGHVWPYTNWVMAATNIQDAVDAAADGGWVLVSSGEYRTGGAVTPGYTLMNRVCVTNRITLQSMFGREASIIVGAPDPLTGGLGSNAVRGVYMTNGAVLCGFTISNGHTLAEAEGNTDEDRSGGGLYVTAGFVSNCSMVLNHAGMRGGGFYGTASTIALVTAQTNEATFGGGFAVVARSTVAAATVHANHSRLSGGGGYANNSDVSECLVQRNTAENGAGGCVLLYAASIRNCTIEENTALSMGALWIVSTGTAVSCSITSNTCAGGALFLTTAEGVASNCTIRYNIANGIGGAGVVFSGVGVLIDSLVEHNTSLSIGGGGGIVCNGGGTVRRCVIRSNRAVANSVTAVGGGIIVDGGTVFDSTIEGNHASDGLTSAGAGGGAYIENGGSIHNSIIRGNSVWNLLDLSAFGYGGGAFILNSGGLYNCLVTGNRAWGIGSSGGGVYCASPQGLVVNCTVTEDNYARGEGGGTAGGTIRNSIVYGNRASGGDNYMGGSFAYSCASPLPPGAGNIADDPQFIADYQLPPYSACVNKGSNEYAVGEWDLAGTNRILFGRVDMGCYECSIPEPALGITMLMLMFHHVRARQSA